MRRAAFARAAAGLAVAALAAAALVGPGADAAARKRTRSTARAAASQPDSNQVLVRIGRETITRADVQRRLEEVPEQFRANYATPEGRQQLLDRMVEERVWLMLATRHGVAERPEVRQQLEQQRRDLLVRTYLNEVMAAHAAPSDSEARAYYEEHRSEYKTPAGVTVRHIMTKTEAEAKRVLQWAKGKQKWDDLAKRFSVDSTTRMNGGNLGSVTPEGNFPSLGPQPALAQAAFALPEGQIGGPIKTDRGWHVLKVENKREEGVRPFEQVRQMIARQLGGQRQQEFYRARLEEARRTLGVRPDSSAIKGFISQKKSARDLFNEAQNIAAPEARINAYRELLRDHPDSDVSPQAQFMIGFIYSEELKNYDEAEAAFRELLRRYPQAELAPSAQWMLEHMREENAPAFIQLEGDSLEAPAGGSIRSTETGAGRRVRPWTPPDSVQAQRKSGSGK